MTVQLNMDELGFMNHKRFKIGGATQAHVKTREQAQETPACIRCNGYVISSTREATPQDPTAET